MVFIGDHVATVLVTEGRTASRQTERNSCCPAKVTHLSGQSPTNFALPFEMRKLSSKKIIAANALHSITSVIDDQQHRLGAELLQSLLHKLL